MTWAFAGVDPRASLARTPTVDKLAPMPTGEDGQRPPTRDEITAALARSLANAVVPVDEDLWERRMRALTLRNGGHTYARIAAELGVHPDTVRNDVHIAKREVLSESIEEGVARQVSVLRDMQHGAYSLAMNGDKDSIMAIVRCLEQEAKLRGFYAPTRQITGISDVDFAQQAADLIAKLGLVPPRELMGGVSGSPRPAITADVSEVIDGIIERVMVGGNPIGFDMVAVALPVEDEPADRAVDRAISDEAVSRAAAEAITGGERGADNERWSNL